MTKNLAFDYDSIVEGMPTSWMTGRMPVTGLDRRMGRDLVRD